MIVVDSSAIVNVLASERRDSALAERIASDADLHAPHVIDLEVTQALRRLVATGELTIDRAFNARSSYADLAITRYPHGRLLDRIWELRDNLTAYDAAFVALGEALDTPVVTTDRRLASAPGHDAVIEAYG